jgi:ubiquinone/menaquinone biosynthesis C-methylase UbiE
MFSKWQARQLAHPWGLVGRFGLAPLWNRRNAALNDAAFSRLNLNPSDRVLDVGFGGGYLLQRIGAFVDQGLVAGVDASATMVRRAEKVFAELLQTGRFEVRCAKAELLPFPSARFTKVCSVNSIFYWEDPSKAIAETWRVLGEQGTLVLCFTCKGSLEKKRFARQGLYLFEPDEVHRMLQAAGFREVSATQQSDTRRDFLCVIGRKG